MGSCNQRQHKRKKKTFLTDLLVLVVGEDKASKRLVSLELDISSPEKGEVKEKKKKAREHERFVSPPQQRAGLDLEGSQRHGLAQQLAASPQRALQKEETALGVGHHGISRALQPSHHLHEP